MIKFWYWYNFGALKDNHSLDFVGTLQLFSYNKSSMNLSYMLQFGLCHLLCSRLLLYAAPN